MPRHGESTSSIMHTKNLPKHLRSQLSDGSRKGVTQVLRPKHKKRQYFVLRASGETFREWVQRNLEESLAGYLFDSFMGVLSVFLVVLHIVVNWNAMRIYNDSWIPPTDFSLNVIFTLEYLMRLYAAFDRFDYLKSFFHLMELVILLPPWIDIIFCQFSDYTVNNDMMRFGRVLRALRVLRLYRLLQFTSSSLQRQILAALFIVICIIISTAGVLQVIEACDTTCEENIKGCKCQDLSFLDLLYFVVVSISTLGYGDIHPVSTNGKFLISYIILLTFILVPIQINRVSTIISSHTDYSSSYKEGKQHPHVIITGHIDVEMLAVFFAEFFHPSNLNWNEKAVILNSIPPTVDIKKILNLYENKVQYIVGSPLLDEDLERAVLQRAVACFVLVNRDSQRPQHADQCSSLITIALRRGNPSCPIYSQVINAQNATTILKMGASDVIVLGLMKFSILGRSCELYGLPTLLLNLLTQSHGEVDARQSPIQWQNPYLHGFMHGIYLVDIPRTFSGLTFGDLIRFLYDKTPVIPLALLTEDGVQFVDMDFKLGATADPNLCCKVYAISKGLNAVEDALQTPPEQILSYRKNIRRKAKSAADIHVDAKEREKKVKPALGNEVEQIRQSLMKTYTSNPDSIVHEEGSLDYEEFATAGVPSDISKHIVVCGFPMDTYQFLKTIREAPLVNEEMGPPPVVFLASAMINEAEYAEIRHFERVYFVLGSPVNFADLTKTRIDSCISVLILTTTTESLYSDPNMIDADAITTLRYIVEISQRTKIPNLIVELDKSTNVKLLSSVANDRRTSTIFKLPTMMGRQISYRTSRRVSSRRDSFFGSLDEGGGRMDAPLVLEEYIASGRVYMDSMLDALLSECYRKPWITQFVHLLINGSSDDPLERRLFQVEVPEEFISLKYSECFRKFLDLANCVCIGLWRPERGVILPHPCVFINPPKDLQVEPGDLFFLVGKPFTFAASSEILAVK